MPLDDSFAIGIIRRMKYRTAVCKRQLVVLGKNQSDLARETNISRISINRFFNNRAVSNATARTIIEKGLRLKMKDVVIPIPTARTHEQRAG